jgi:hypothetical protein
MDGYWVTDRLIIWIDFDPQGRVAERVGIPARPFRHRPLDTLRRWIGL